MPFFSRHPEPEEPEVVRPQPQPEPEVKQHHGLFGSLRRNPSPSPSAATNGTRNTATTAQTTAPVAAQNGNNGGLFRHSTDAASTTSSTRGSRSFLHRSFGNGNDDDSHLDPSILQARERVLSAEAAERDADRALEIARREVVAAREHVRQLELEAKEEARRAKIKQFHAREVSNRAKPLGRNHGF